MSRWHEPQECPTCHVVTATRVPRDGDGSLVLFVDHGPRADRCPGSRQPPPGYSWGTYDPILEARR